MFKRPAIRSTWPLAVALALVVGAGTGCDQSATSPEAPPLEPTSLEELAQVSEEEAVARGWFFSCWHPYHRRTPEDALEQLMSAYNDRDWRQLRPVFNGRFLFHTASTPGVPETLTRGETMRALKRMFEDPNVLSVELDMEYGDASRVGWRAAEVEVSSVQLTVVKASEFGGELTFVVRGDPARFTFRRGPSILRSWAGWQVAAQHDLHGQGEEGARIEVESSWTEILMPYLQDDDGGSGGW